MAFCSPKEGPQHRLLRSNDVALAIDYEQIKKQQTKEDCVKNDPVFKVCAKHHK
jgi:hypothetical protein